MPLEKGSSKDTIRRNFEEFGKGPTYEHTTRKFGRARANKQRIAVVLSEARKTGGRNVPARRSPKRG